MQLQTIGQVSKQLNISVRTLHYYEQINLISPVKNDGNAYRMYDEDDLLRLRQIVVLRKLRFPLKQIAEILKSSDVRVAIEAFERSLAEVDDELTALSTIRKVIAAFIERLNLSNDTPALLDDENLLEIVDSLTVSKINLREEKTMNETVTMEALDKASENLNKLREKHVRVVRLPKMTVAYLKAVLTGDNSNEPEQHGIMGFCKRLMGEFIEQTNLMEIKPDFKYYENVNGRFTRCEVRLTIPEGLEIPERFLNYEHPRGVYDVQMEKTVFPGGLYAAYMATAESFSESDSERPTASYAANSDKYEWRAGESGFEEHINKFNQFGLNTDDHEYWDYYLPIKEIETATDGQLEKLAKTEAPASQNTPTTIDPAELTADAKGTLKTTQKFSLPLKINLRAKINGENGWLSLLYGYGEVMFNWQHKPSTLLMRDAADLSYNYHKNHGEIPVGEFVDIEWILGTEVMAVKVNGQIRYVSDNCRYIKAFEYSPIFGMAAAVSLGTAKDSPLTIEKLAVTEITYENKNIEQNELISKPAAPRSAPKNIALESLIPQGKVKSRFENGLLIIENGGGSNCMFTKQRFNGAVKIELRAKTDSHDIRLAYHQGLMVINRSDGTMRLQDAVFEFAQNYGGGAVPVNEFTDIEWIVGTDRMSVKINGELRRTETNFPYMRDFRDNPPNPAPVRISGGNGSAITVESLRVTEVF
jgi:DNA-binding transcriptional MerR regulator